MIKVMTLTGEKLSFEAERFDYGNNVLAIFTGDVLIACFNTDNIIGAWIEVEGSVQALANKNEVLSEVEE